jgi:hypothetical protein
MAMLAKIECLTPEIAAEAASLALSGHVVGTAAIVLVDNAGQLGRLQGMVAGWIGDLTSEDEQGA